MPVLDAVLWILLLMTGKAPLRSGREPS
jgi:hypothetical protein